jgi:hypothetical protein
MLHKGSGVTPIPDPTTLTTAALAREITSLKELLFTRLDAMDKAQELFDLNLNRVPTAVDKQVGNLKELLTTLFDSRWEMLLDKIDTRVKEVDHNEAEMIALINQKFAGVDQRFEERDIRMAQLAGNNKSNLDAALAAAEKATFKQTETFSATILKTEVSTSKQIDTQGETIKTSTNALNDKIEDVRTRLARIEAAREGSNDERHNRMSSGTYTLGFVGLFVTIISVGFAIYVGTRSTQVQQTPPQIIYVPQGASSTTPTIPVK